MSVISIDIAHRNTGITACCDERHIVIFADAVGKQVKRLVASAEFNGI
jgi:hypothetical protein